jgi:O-antigen/teichoic acid export membrane protein
VDNLNTNEVKKIMVKDTMLYLPARIIEGAIGLLTISLYTRFFAPDIYGTYGIITTTVNISSLLLLGWLIQSVFRYVNDFDGNKKKVLFFSTSFTLWVLINGVILSGGLAGIFLFSRSNEAWLTQLYILVIFMFISYNTTQILINVLSATRRTKLLLGLSIFSVAAKLLLTTFFVYYFKTNSTTPAAAVISHIIVDAIFILIAVQRTRIYRYITFRLFSKKVLRKFLVYSMPLVGVNITMSMLTLSDRYVITPILGTEKMGIYHANYSISSSVFTLILVAVMRGVYPVILKTWRLNNKPQTEHFLSQAVRYFLLISMPAFTGICILSDTISKLFLDPKFYEQGFVIIWVAAGMLFFGLAEYSNKAWELTSNTKPLFYNTVISAVINLGINIIFIPIYGYRVAAVSTAFSYFVYLTLSLVRSRKILKIDFSIKSLSRIFFSCAVMGISVFLAVEYLSSSFIALPFIILFGIAVYFVCLYVSREIDNEVKYAVNWLKDKKIRKNKQELP